MVGEAFRMIGTTIERDMARAETMPSPPPTSLPIDEPELEQPAEADIPSVLVVDEPVANAAAILGVAPDATEDEIRAALRSRLSSSRLHPDHGGDGDAAKRLIAAKNLLIEHAKAARL